MRTRAMGMPPRRGYRTAMMKAHDEERERKRKARAEQGWQRRLPLTVTVRQRPHALSSAMYERPVLARLAQSRVPR